MIGCGRPQIGVSCRRMVEGQPNRVPVLRRCFYARDHWQAGRGCIIKIRQEKNICLLPYLRDSLIGKPLLFMERRGQSLDSTGTVKWVAVRSEAAIFKRPRKKKTLAELKEEESFLLKERRNLKNQLAALRVTVEKQRATNESLRKIKLDLQLPLTTMKATTSVVPGESISYQLEQVNAVGVPTKIMPTIVHCSNLGASQSSCPPNVSCKVEEAGSQDAAFSLPDLNLPFGNDPSSEVLYRTS